MPDQIVPPDVLSLLRCPKTGRPLRLDTRDGQSVLVTDDGRQTYAIRDGIPILLPPEQEPIEPSASNTEKQP